MMITLRREFILIFLRIVTILQTATSYTSPDKLQFRRELLILWKYQTEILPWRI